jgi:hypothetical protein
MADLFLKADVASYMGITLTSDQGTLLDNQIIPSISQYARNFCNRTFDATGDITELFDGGFNTFFVREIPISQIKEVKVDGSILGSDEYYNYHHYVKIDDAPLFGFQNVSIKYTTSNTVPKDLKESLIRWGSQSLESSGLGSGSVSEEELKRFTAGSVSVEFKDDQTEQSVFANGIYIPSYAYDALIRYRLEPK